MKSDPPAKPMGVCGRYFGGFKALFSNPCCMWLTLGGMCRFWQGYTLTYYSFSFFNLYHKDDLYGAVNAISVLIGGFTSSLAAGIICDKYERVNYRTKSYVIVLQSLAAIPICCVAFLTT